MANNYISFKKITLLSGQTIQQWFDTYYNTTLHQYTRFTFYNSDGNIVGEYIGDKVVINGVNEAELLTKEDKINKVATIGSTPTDINYPSEKAVKTALDNLLTTVNTSLNAKQNSLGFTPENVANKQTTITDSDTDYPTTKAVKTYTDGAINTLASQKVDYAPDDGKVYGQQNKSWFALNSDSDLREALAFEGTWDTEAWKPRDDIEEIDGGDI